MTLKRFDKIDVLAALIGILALTALQQSSSFGAVLWYSILGAFSGLGLSFFYKKLTGKE